MSKLFFLFKEGIRNIWRHKMTAVTAIISVFLALLVIGIFVVIQQNSHHFIERIRSEYKIEVFFTDDVDNDQGQEIVNQIKTIDDISSVKLITKEEALNIYQSDFGEDLFKLLGHNPLPVSAVIELDKSGNEEIDVEPLIDSIQNLDNIDEVVYEGTLIRRIEYFYNITVKILTYIAIALLVITIIVISNTVKLSVYAKQDLIKNLKSIGASKRFIKTPFIIEGILEGVIGAGLAVAVIFILVNATNKYFSELVTFNIDFNLIGVAWIIGIAILIGFIGSYRGIRVLLK